MTKPLPPSSLALQCGDVVVVPFPYSDRLAEKRRPALVVSNSQLSREGLVWLMMITSARSSGSPFDCPVLDLAQAGLPAACVVRPTKMTTVEPSRILRRTGRLGAAELERVLEAARSFLGPEATTAASSFETLRKGSAPQDEGA